MSRRSTGYQYSDGSDIFEGDKVIVSVCYGWDAGDNQETVIWSDPLGRLVFSGRSKYDGHDFEWWAKYSFLDRA